jgi:hypothetical protein
MEETDAWIYIWENIKKQAKSTSMKEYEIVKDEPQRPEILLNDENNKMFKPYHEY